MALRTYKLTSVVVNALKAMLGVDLRVTGTEHLVDQPTLFVANHFTRIETFLIPYVIFEHAQRPVRCLGTHSVFKGIFGKYFRSIGGMSTRDPRRNRTIIRELMTGRWDWVIYPEGGLIKNKKMLYRGRLQLDHPERHGPPHTGAAMLALKAVMCKHRYLEACHEDDLRRMEYYEEAYGLTDCDQICPREIVIVPVTLTFYPMRPSRNLINRLARLIMRDLDPRLDEELQVEGSILLKGSQISIHFGEPIEAAKYLGKVTAMARRVVGVFSEASRTDFFLRQQARRLTEECMRSIYSNVEINFDHLLAFGLRAFGGERIATEDLHRALYLAAVELASDPSARLHPSVGNGIASLVTGQPYEPLASSLRLAGKEGILGCHNGYYLIDQEALAQVHEFHNIRLEKILQVIGNEVEPVRPVVEALKRHVNLSSAQLRSKTSQALRDGQIARYERDYQAVYRPEVSKPREFGEPFFLEKADARAGVVLVHGYLSCPEQVRPLGTYLNSRGWCVYGVRLGGHGTAPKQLTEVLWTQWMEDVTRGCAILRQHCKTIVVGGFSLGGTLALLAAVGPGAGIQGVFSINAPVKLRDPRAPFLGPIVGWNGMMRMLGLTDGYYRLLNDDTESPDLNYKTYDLASIRQLRLAVRASQKRLGGVKAPALVIQSTKDPLVGPDGAASLMERLGGRDKVLVALPFDRHVIVRGEGSEKVFDAVGRFVKRIAGEA